MIVRKSSLLFSLLAILALIVGYYVTQTPVTIVLDGLPVEVRTHRTVTADLLNELAITIRPGDTVDPPPGTPLARGAVIRIARPRAVAIEIDNTSTSLQTYATTLGAILSEAHLKLNPRDLIQVNGEDVALASAFIPVPESALHAVALASFSQPLQSAVSARGAAGAARQQILAQEDPRQAPAPVTVTVRRAVPVEIRDGRLISAMTAARTVGEALFNEGVYIYAADIVQPGLGTPLATGMRIDIQRANPATVTVDGRTFGTRSQAATVGELLASEGVALQGKDYARPAANTAVSAEMSVQVIRVREETVTAATAIPFKTEWRADANLEIDHRTVGNEGKDGVFKRDTIITYENGQEVKRTLDREWVDLEPTTRVIMYGTKIVVRTLDTAQGTVSYWRSLPIYATYYTAATSGKTRDDPAYGITRTGRWATKGVIAVDPSVIPLHTPLYVPGYGLGAAEDTGGMIIGRHIDLAYDEDDTSSHHYGWTTVYLLTPVPSAQNIIWILSDYPDGPR